MSPAVRARVLVAVAELGYVRNSAARALRTGRSSSLVLVPLDIANPFFAEVLVGVEEVADEHGLVVLVRNSLLDGSRQSAVLTWAVEQRTRGVLITPSDSALPALRQVQASGTPVVTVGRVLPGFAGCSARTDDVRGGQLAAEHLLANGHTRLAYVGSHSDERRQGVLEVLPDSADLLDVVLGYGELLTGDRAAEALLQVPAAVRPTAALCANDLVALRLLSSLRARGVAVPDELAVMGFDDVHLAEAAPVPLTTMRQPARDIGRAAARLALDELDRGLEHEHADRVFQPTLVPRASA